MRRPPVTVVILAWNAWDTTRACLEALRPTLGARDQVVVVDNGSTDATPGQLRGYPWVEVVTNAENHGFGGGCNDGAARARHDVIVFLNNDTLPVGHWIDALVAPFEDPTVGASGPCSNFVSGPQLATGASYVDRGAMRRFARAWAQEHRGSVVEVPRLVGFCLAVRRSLFETLDGFDLSYGIGGYEDDDLCLRLRQAGHRLVIAEESFVHHEGHKTFDANGLDWYAEQESNRDRFEAQAVGSGAADARRNDVLVSACLITRDEAADIATCLASLQGVADEIVVYDTGSEDDTVAIAGAAGATVVEGYWDDDFSRARNAALEHCTGTWIAWVDADETLRCDDPEGLRRQLAATDPALDGYSVSIDNAIGSGVEAGFVHTACRLFRRAVCEWTGRLHEQVAGRGDHRPIRQAPLETARIRHTGYLDEAMRSRGKVERNLRVAEAEVANDDGWDRSFSVTSLGRSYLTAGRFTEALEHCAGAFDSTDNGVTRRLAAATCAEALLALGRTDEALEWTGTLRSVSATSVRADALEARIHLARAEYDHAWRLLDSLGAHDRDDDGFEQTPAMLATARAQALAGLERPAEAAEILLTSLEDDGVLDAHLAVVIGYLRQGGRPLTELTRRFPTETAPVFLAQVLQLPDDDADAVLEACMETMSPPTAALAAAASLARRLPLERALVWSARLRAGGHAQACPVIAVALDGATNAERARAAAVAVQAFGDERGRGALAAAAATATTEELAGIRAEVGVLCPSLLAVLPAVASGPATAPNQVLNPTAAPSSPTSEESDPAPTVPAQPAVTVPAGVAAQACVTVQDAVTAEEPGQPRVSIVIPCFDQAEHTVRCLQSLAASTDPALIEVILVDNGSSDATRQLAGLQDERFKVVRNEENTGFGPACNQGAALARGELLLFLNNDTVVSSGWLDPLVAAMDEDDRLGAVQPRLLSPDGRLSDAGGLVFAGGVPWVYGKGHPDPDAPRFTTRRAPDYASGACLLVRRGAFESVGGFDDRYAPAYFEDTDLSFALRAAGWKVLYEPASTIVHVEGGTAGTDLSSGLKRYQTRNAARFAEKWAGEIAGRRPVDPAAVTRWAHRPQGGFGPGEVLEITGERAWAHARRRAEGAQSVLVLDPAMPMYDRAAGSLRIFHLLRSLRRAGHAVTFYALGGGDRRYADAVSRFGVTCYGGDRARAADPAYATTYFPPLGQLLAGDEFDTVIVTPWDTAERAVDVVRASAPRATLVVDTCDVSFVRLDRAAELSGKREDRMRALDTRRRELAVYRQADRLVFVTEDDRDAVARELGAIDSLVLPVVHEALDRGPGFADRAGCLFVGNFLHPPNTDAVTWWRDAIAPRLSTRSSELSLTVAGNDPGGVARALAGPGLEVVGTVESTLPLLHRARVSVAPLRYGAGMKGKVVEALAAGLPVVATSVATEGIGLVDGEHVLVADEAGAFAAAVERLHRDPELWSRLSEAGRSHVLEHFGLERMRRGIDGLLAPARRPVTV